MASSPGSGVARSGRSRSLVVGPRPYVRVLGTLPDRPLLAAVLDPARVAAGAEGVWVQADQDRDAGRCAQWAAWPDRHPPSPGAWPPRPFIGRGGRSLADASAWRLGENAGPRCVNGIHVPSGLDSMVNIVHCQDHRSGDVNIVERRMASPSQRPGDDPARPLTG